ncbi:MAG: ATP-binding protein [Lysobacteraceae bacterium]|nr:MAG: ATP-binding protein [Xanthomonadaceae bacterium]
MNSEDQATGRNSAPDQDLRALEQSLQRFSKRIDRGLRGHFATHGLRRLLSRPKSPRDLGRRIMLSAPSAWLVVISVALVALAVASAFVPRLAVWLPRISLWLVAAWIGLLLIFERLILPRIALARHHFRLMRMEREDGGGEFSDVYIAARVKDSSTGFGMQAWKPLRGVSPGDIVVAVSDANERGVALIPLRTEGHLPVYVWSRELYMHDAFSPLSEKIRILAHQFDQACDRNMQAAGLIERSRALRSGKVLPKTPADPQRIWAGIALSDGVRKRLASLAEHFATGSASATRGLLLYGPPGTGKTLIAKTFADSMGCTFFPLSLPDLKSGFIGQSGENVRSLWNKARAETRAVIFIDECDSVFGRRGGVNTDSFVEEIVAAFLAQWDGFNKQTNVWVVGATNRRDLLDAAILSRFEEQLEIGLPDGPQRLHILEKELRKLGADSPLPPETESLTQGMSGRDMANLARRLVREHGEQTQITSDLLSDLTVAARRQGSTSTDARASWDTLILPETTLKELKVTAGLLRHADSFIKRGVGVPRGLLLYGPPGTGKTQIARTLANETGLRFIGASTADIKQGFLGQSGQKVRELFARARESAPSLLFIDEIDIIAPDRGSQGDSIAVEIVGQLLQEIDGVAAHPQPVFVLAATNRIDQLDQAVLSRLPKKIEIGLPDRDGAERMLRVMLRGKPLDFDIATGAHRLAAAASGMSGRDLRSWVEAAEHHAVARAIEAGDPDSIVIRLEDFPPP